jgi:hypothetical protein
LDPGLLSLGLQYEDPCPSLFPTFPIHVDDRCGQ